MCLNDKVADDDDDGDDDDVHDCACVKADENNTTRAAISSTVCEDGNDSMSNSTTECIPAAFSCDGQTDNDDSSNGHKCQGQ